jgi:eukaryotic-like serine/threonine-protein kinase
MTRLGVSYGDVGRRPEGLALLEDALALARKRPGTLPAMLPRALAAGYDGGGQFARSEPLYRDFVEQARQRHRADHPQVARALNALGLNLVRQRKAAEAEAVLRACPAVRETNRPRARTAFETRVLLGRALALQKKYAEAEPLLRTGYQGLKRHTDKVPPGDSFRPCEALDWLIEVADAQGDTEAAGRWRKERGAIAPAAAAP